MIRLGTLLLFLVASSMAFPASARASNPQAVFARHDPHGRLPNTRIQRLGTIGVKSATYSIYHLDYSNPVSLHGLQQIAVIRNGNQFMGSYVCRLGEGEDQAKVTIGKDRLTVRISGMSFDIRFDETGPTRNKYFCGEGSGWHDSI